MAGNTTVTAIVWLARGSGTNNRYVRVTIGNANSFASVTSGCYVDVDLQAGTVGTVTAIGAGTATSASIVASGSGYLVKITGAVSITGQNYVILSACSALATVSFAGATNQCFIYDHVALVAASSISDTTFNVNADTGWLNGDVICVAATTRTPTDCEIYLLNADAGASSMTSGLYPFGGVQVSTHHGTGLVTAQIGLLTRNVKIRSTSPTLMAYVYCTALATTIVSWTEFYYIGTTSASNKRGIEIDAGSITNSKNFSYCSIHDCDSQAYYLANSSFASLNVTISNCIIWNVGAYGILLLSAVVNPDWTFDSNLIILTGNYGFYLSDVGGVCTNNTVVGTKTNYGFYLREINGVIGTFDNNTTQSSVGVFNTDIDGLSGTISNFSGFRCYIAGFNIASSNMDLKLTNLTLIGNQSNPAQLSVVNGNGVLTIETGIIAKDALYNNTFGISASLNGIFALRMSNVDMSGTGAGLAPHSLADINIIQSSGIPLVFSESFNCKFGAPDLIYSKANWSARSYLSFQKFNQTAGDHRTEMTYGQLKTDSVVYHTASPSMRMTPSDVSNKLESSPKDKGVLVAVASGATVSISVFVNKDAAYNGNQPRLIQRANPALGQNSDVVLATYSAGTGSWNQLTATSSMANDDGAWEFVVDCDGTAGFINIDDWSVS
jgi:hypothetical protein